MLYYLLPPLSDIAPLLGFLNVHQSLIQIEWRYVAIGLRMGQSLIDVIELDAQGRIIAVHCLQTGDIPQERRSRQTAKHQHGVMSLQFVEPEFMAGRIE